MAKESLGFVKLEWTCPQCGSRNPGPEKTCLGCGAPQPENVHFVQAETQTLVTDEKEIAQAKAGADIHCAFCGARNPAGTATCSQCGADLKEGTQREAGQVVGAFQSGPEPEIACKNCGVLNQQSALKCIGCGANLQTSAAPVAAPVPAPVAKAPNRLALIIMGALLVLCLVAVIAGMVMSSKTDGRNGVVQSVQWESSIPILGLAPVRYQNWYDEIPSDASIGQCSDRVYTIQNEPTENAEKVCGTPYTVDRGSGYAEVVQDCQYQVYKDYCDYTVQEWVVVDRAVLSGDDFSPQVPQPALLDGQIFGDPQVEYSIVFSTDQGSYVYNTTDINVFRQFSVGSEWLLNINTFDRLISVEPLD
jgi:DNA-directed RNA polymerase subunit RPC12/RpoP